MARMMGLLVLSLMFALGFSQEMTADRLIRKVNEIMNPETAYSKLRLIIQTTSGKERTFEYDSWAKDRGEKMLMRYIYPKRTKGQAILMLNNADDIWMYFPRTNRVRKMATHARKQKFEGSDFTYEDFGSGDSFIEDFIPEIIKSESKDKAECWVLQLTKKKSSHVGYSKLIMWVDKALFVPVEIHYFDENHPDRLKKVLYLQDIRVIDKIPTAMRMVMENKEDDSKTVMETLEVQYNIDIPDEWFTENYLKRR